MPYQYFDIMTLQEYINNVKQSFACIVSIIIIAIIFNIVHALWRKVSNKKRKDCDRFNDIDKKT